MNSRSLYAILSLLFLAGSSFGAPCSAETFDTVRPGKVLEFPRDHGSHPRYATEWWYFTGHLSTEQGRTFGFQLTFFRVGITPERRSPSNWESPSIFLGHFAITDDLTGRFYHTERSERASFGRADAAEERLAIRLNSWSAELNGDQLTLHASDDLAALHLALRPRKPLVLQGDNGYSRKGPAEGEASYYTSFSRLEGSGDLRLSDQAQQISRASVWMDHEVTSANLNPEYQGWDWFAVQLDSGEELMIYRLRSKSGEPSPFSSGTFVRADGSTVKLQASDFTLRPAAFWTSKATGTRYPVRWTLSVPLLQLQLSLAPTVDNQELVTGRSTGVTYWEGRCTVSGLRGDSAINGSAYQELVGYRGAVVFRP